MDKARVRVGIAVRVRVDCNYINEGVHTHHPLSVRVSVVFIRARNVVRATLM